MAKLEELTELLVAEIKDFENGIQKLEKIQNERIGLDISEINSLLLSHQDFLTKNNADLEQKMVRLQSKMDSGTIFPKWAVIFFLLSLAMNMVFIIWFSLK